VSVIDGRRTSIQSIAQHIAVATIEEVKKDPRPKARFSGGEGAPLALRLYVGLGGALRLPYPKAHPKPKPYRETGKQGNRETGKQGNRETGKQGNRETGKQGNRETEKQGNRETGKQGNREVASALRPCTQASRLRPPVFTIGAGSSRLAVETIA
jgi:hypothetical protein